MENVGIWLKIISFGKKKVLELSSSPEKRKLVILQHLMIHILHVTSGLNNLTQKTHSKNYLKSIYEDESHEIRELFSPEEINEIWTILASVRMYYWAVWYSEYNNDEFKKIVADRVFKISTNVYRTNSNESYIKKIFENRPNEQVLTKEEIYQLNATIIADLSPLEVMIHKLKIKLAI